MWSEWPKNDDNYSFRQHNDAKVSVCSSVFVYFVRFFVSFVLCLRNNERIMCDITECAIATQTTATTATTATSTKVNNYAITYRLLCALFV